MCVQEFSEATGVWMTIVRSEAVSGAEAGHCSVFISVSVRLTARYTLHSRTCQNGRDPGNASMNLYMVHVLKRMPVIFFCTLTMQVVSDLQGC